MRIAVFGLGYVGSVSAACFCRLGHEIIGVDTNSLKVKMINNGKSPVLERGLSELIETFVAEGRLRATEDVREAVEFADVSLICVGTPSYATGEISVTHVANALQQLGHQLKNKNKYHVIALRSTLLPDVFVNELLPQLIQSSGKEIGVDYGVALYPEFLREGTAISDFLNPPKVVIGELDQRSGDVIFELNKSIQAPIFRTDLTTAGMVKYVDNCYHALKIVFANEVGRMCQSLKIDSNKVMEVFCSDRKLNISTAYLKPGFAFGGSCLPKDVRAFTYKAKQLDVVVPMLNSLLESNNEHIRLLINKLISLDSKQLGFIGLAFKEGTDDLRESPIVEVIERMIGKGYSVSIYDENVMLSNLMGANRAFIEKEIPHISRLMTDNVRKVIAASEVVVVSQKAPDLTESLMSLTKEKTVIDLVGSIENPAALDGQYLRLC